MTGIKLKRNNILAVLLGLFLAGSFLTSCSSTQGVVLRDQPQSLANIKKAIAGSLPGGVRTKSNNGREHSSQFFDIATYEVIFEPEKAAERYYAKVIILGDRRPYSLDVMVFRQKRHGDQYYDDSDVDPKASKKIASDLKSKLAQSRDDTNVIDEFRAF